MVQITISALTPSTPPADGWKVEYRIKDSSGAYTTATGSPFSSLPIVFSTTDPAGTLYEVNVWRDCGTLESVKFELITPCGCTGSGYVPNEDQSGCKKTTTIAATVTSSGYCLAATGNAVYSSYGTRIYKTGFDVTTVFLAPGTIDTYIYGNNTNNPQWANTTLSSVQGPMNRRAVWIDTNCDGNVDALSSGTNTTIAFMFNNTGLKRTIYVAIAADNQFKLVVNGNVIVDTTGHSSDIQFKLWHVFPVVLNVGINYFNGVAVGDGSVSDAIAMVGYDNTNAQILSAINENSLNIMFDSVDLRGGDYTVATCPPTYSLDTSGGEDSYVCVRVQTKVCNSAT